MKLIFLKNFYVTLKLFVAVLLMLLISVFSTVAMAADFDATDNFGKSQSEMSLRDFNHLATGFSLSGEHSLAECGACHVGGVFKGTPRNCSGCHSKGKRVVATVMPTNHIVTTDPCEVCHSSTVTFLGARYNHGKAQPGYCTTCHNGLVATGKPSNHNNSSLMATGACDSCHRTFAWLPSTFNHTGVMPGACSTCHNGVATTGRPASHSSTSLKSQKSCDTCHRFGGWYPTFYNHSTVAPGTCSNCHNTVSATGKPANHTGARATMSCDRCHSTSAWLPAAYNHAGVAPGTCANCHGAQRPASHASRGYTASCDKCHTTSSWAFNHAAQQGQHLCNNCHQHHNNSTPCDQCHSVNSWGGH